MIHLYYVIIYFITNVQHRTHYTRTRTRTLTYAQVKMTRFFSILIYYLVDLISIRQRVASIVVGWFLYLFCYWCSCCRRCHSHSHRHCRYCRAFSSRCSCCCRRRRRCWYCCLNWNHTLKTNTFFQIHTHTQTDDYNSSPFQIGN